MPISDPRDRFFYPHHTPMKDTYYLGQVFQSIFTLTKLLVADLLSLTVLTKSVAVICFAEEL